MYEEINYKFVEPAQSEERDRRVGGRMGGTDVESAH